MRQLENTSGKTSVSYTYLSCFTSRSCGDCLRAPSVRSFLMFSSFLNGETHVMQLIIEHVPRLYCSRDAFKFNALISTVEYILLGQIFPLKTVWHTKGLSWPVSYLFYFHQENIRAMGHISIPKTFSQTSCPLESVRYPL